MQFKYFEVDIIVYISYFFVSDMAIIIYLVDSLDLKTYTYIYLNFVD